MKNDTVHVIGHDHKITQCKIHVRPLVRDEEPLIERLMACFGQMHFIISDVAEKMLVLIGADSDEVRRGIPIIPTR